MKRLVNLFIFLVFLFVVVALLQGQFISTNVVYWDDLRFPVGTQTLPAGAANIVPDTANVGLDFQTDADISTDWTYFTAQMPHGYKFGTNIHFHIHWEQDEDNTPNWLVDYRCYDIGEDSSAAFTSVAWDHNEVAYSAGTISQMTSWAGFNPSFTSVSGMCDIKLFRDTDNSSTEFAGADPFTTDALVKEFDIHVSSDTVGSYAEGAKH